VDCVDCHSSQRYDYSTSSQYSLIEKQAQHVKYGTGNVVGYFSKDMICITQEDASCIDEYRLLSVFQTNSLSGLRADGILGLSPSTQKAGTSLFVDELAEKGTIDKKMFSFYVSKGQSNSRVIFGGYDMKYAKPNSTVTWNDLINDHYWSVSLVRVRLGEKEVPISTSTAIVDTGTSYLLVPSTDFAYLTQEFSKTMKCGIDRMNKLYACMCSYDTYQQFPDFKI